MAALAFNVVVIAAQLVDFPPYTLLCSRHTTPTY
jgi:hypothetical protein